MAISDHDRKVLWGRAGGMCSKCRRQLVADATPTDRESVVGEEAHIVADKIDGPRGSPPLPKPELDSYGNKILLCNVCHKIIDDQPIAYTRERVHKLKDDHERWVAELPRTQELKPVRVIPTTEWASLLHLTTGSEAWNVVRNTGFTRFAGLDDEDSEPEDVDLVDWFLGLLGDWGDIAADVEMAGPAGVRDAKRSLGEALKELADRRIVVFGGQRALRITGGVRPDTEMAEMVVLVLPEDEAPHADDGSIATMIVQRIPR
ncbi:hypothetical protein ABH935_009820 [Catenulispora sp. GAS73]|uniref:hypothetical protein n=1 Tax=Catenulispora sp. GAS73 TaxID=3156269 RepID=UPI00351901C9